jgi:hypothetical protein
MFNFKQIRLNVDRLVSCTFGFYNHNNKYINNVLFAFVAMNSMNSLMFGGILLHILEINLSITPSIKLLFVYMFSFLALVRPILFVFEVLILRLTERAE